MQSLSKVLYGVATATIAKEACALSIVNMAQIPLSAGAELLAASGLAQFEDISFAAFLDSHAETVGQKDTERFIAFTLNNLNMALSD